MRSPRSRQRRAIATSPEKQCMIPPASLTRSSARMASTSAWASRQCTTTGLRTRRARPTQYRNTRSCAPRGGRLRKKSRPISPPAPTRGPPARGSSSVSTSPPAPPAAALHRGKADDVDDLALAAPHVIHGLLEARRRVDRGIGDEAVLEQRGGGDRRARLEGVHSADVPPQPRVGQEEGRGRDRN